MSLNRPPLFVLCAAAVLACRELVAALAPQTDPGPVMRQVRAVLDRDEAKWIAFRRDLHRHPELPGAEARTSQAVAAELRALELEVREGVGGFGVVGILRGARPGPLLAYRADMDAVQSSAPDPVEFASLNAGVRHICGHDLHTTVALALASALRQVRDSLAGAVMFVFQPAEERATGARAMLADGVFAAQRPAEIYGLHTSPYETGTLATTPGPMMAGRDRFEIVLSGQGNLAAAVAATNQRLVALSTMDAGQILAPQPPDFVLVQFNQPRWSGKEARLTGTVLVAAPASRARVRAMIEAGLASGMPPGVTVAAAYDAKAVAGVTNDSALAASAAAAVRALLGDRAVAAAATILPAFSEDFGSFQEHVPGVFFYLGVANAARGWSGMPHSPDYVADERAITVGALAMAGVLVDRLRGK